MIGRQGQEGIGLGPGPDERRKLEGWQVKSERVGMKGWPGRRQGGLFCELGGAFGELGTICYFPKSCYTAIAPSRRIVPNRFSFCVQ